MYVWYIWTIFTQTPGHPVFRLLEILVKSQYFHYIFKDLFPRRSLCSSFVGNVAQSTAPDLLNANLPHKNAFKMAFGDVTTPQGLKELNAFLADNSYISG